MTIHVSGGGGGGGGTPTFSGARLKNDTGINATSGATINVDFISAVYDTGNYWQPGVSTGGATVPKTGYYLVIAKLQSDDPSLTGGYDLTISAPHSDTRETAGHGVANDGMQGEVSEIVHALSGDTIGASFIQYAGTTQLMYCWLSIAYLGT